MQTICKANYKGGVTPENLAYILDCIIYRGIMHKDNYYSKMDDDGNRYIPLKAAYLNNIIPQYENCIRFLTDNGIIECNNHFITGSKCKGYRLAKEYIGNSWGEYAVAEKSSIEKKLFKQKNEYLKANRTVAELEESRQHIISFLKNPLLKIDVNEALKEIEAYAEKKFAEQKEKALREGKEFNTLDTINKIRQTQNNFRHLVKIIANPLEDRSKYCTVDTAGYRLHTLYTRMPKFLRNCLTYDGQPLIALDLKNSQPYFSLLMLQQRFYERKKGQFSLFDINKELFKILNNKINNISVNINNNKLSITLPKSTETLTGKGFETLNLYIQDVRKGMVYDRFVDMEKEHPNFRAKRKEIKTMFLVAAYSNPYKSKINRLYYETYPVPFTVFNTVKKLYKKGQNKLHAGIEKENKWYGILATTLQRIESYWLLDVVCKRLENEHPAIPLITVHDCIATTPQYVDCVKQIIEEVLTGAVGYAPVIEKEAWNKNNVKAAA